MPSSRTDRILAATALLVAVSLTGCADDGSRAPDAASPAPVATTSVPAEPAQRVGTRAQPPTAVVLPSGRRVPVLAVSTRANGVLDVPDDVDTAGWWSGGARLGDPFGSTLVAGHVDSTDQGLGAYAELLSVAADDRIRVYSSGLRQDFEVAALRLIGADDVTRERGLYAASGERRLTLVTCAPPYVPERGGYQRLAVVTALPVAAPADRGDR